MLVDSVISTWDPVLDVIARDSETPFCGTIVATSPPWGTMAMDRAANVRAPELTRPCSICIEYDDLVGDVTLIMRDILDDRHRECLSRKHLASVISEFDVAGMIAR